MVLKTKMLQRFVGGQMEIQNELEGHLYRGEVESIKVEGGKLHVRFAWLAKGEGFPPLPKKWVKSGQLDYLASLEIYSVNNIGPGTEGGDRLCLRSLIIGELAVLFPPDGSKLDPAKVEGLQIAQPQPVLSPERV